MADTLSGEAVELAEATARQLNRLHDLSARPDLSNVGALAFAHKAFSATEGDVPRSLAERFSETVNVRDRGAKGDDDTDDTAAFASAAAIGKPVVIPPGVYRVGGVVFTSRVTLMSGAKVRRTGRGLYFAGGIDAPAGEQIFLDAVHPNVDINNTLSPEGWVDWFGYDADAIESCHKIFRVNRFGPRDYVCTRTVVLDQSYREVEGAYGSAEGFGGTRIVLTGEAAADQPVVRVGTLNTDSVLSCSRRLNIRGINTIRDGVVNPSQTNRRQDAVPGWKIGGWYEGQLSHCFDYGSPIHYRVLGGTVSCVIQDCWGVRPAVGSLNGYADYYTAFCIGSYTPSFGAPVGSNWSLLVRDCGTDGGSAGASRMGLYLFGCIADTWISKFEDSNLEYGIFIDGADESGAPIAALAAHQDVRLENCVLDAHVTSALTVQNINAGGAITVHNMYGAMATAGDCVLLNNNRGSISMSDGELLGNSFVSTFGIRIAGSKRVYVAPSVKIKDFKVGLRCESSGPCRVEPTITRTTAGGTNALELAGAYRCRVAPTIDADTAVFDYGVSSDAETSFCEVNVTLVNPSSLTTGSAARKIWHNGAAVPSTPYGNGNERTGVVG